MTGGNYRLRRSISYPDYPASKIETDAQVTATTQGEWDTNITVSGTYDGPTDVVSVQDYEVTWSGEGSNILESGSATLALRSGNTLRQMWTSTITPRDAFTRFPPAGEAITISVSPFEVAGDSMTYRWEGTVRVRPQ